MEVIQTKTPGKLYVAGEYAVVESGYSAIIIAIDLFVGVKIQETAENMGLFYSEGFTADFVPWKRVNGCFQFTLDQENLNYVQSAIHVTEKYIAEQGISLKLFDLSMESELDSLSNKKLGVGSSGAVTVGIVRSLLQFYGLEDTDLLVYKLSVISQLRLGVNSSFGDLAASTYTGWIKYSSFDRLFIQQALEHQSLTEVVHSTWSFLEIKELTIPSSIELLIGWTGSPASSDDLVGNVQKRKKQAQSNYNSFLLESKESVSLLEKGLAEENQENISTAIHRNRQALLKMGQETNNPIETPHLRKLIDIANHHQAVAKTSGAGGGDSGIAFIFPETDKETILKEWKLENITRLPLKIFKK